MPRRALAALAAALVTLAPVPSSAPVGASGPAGAAAAWSPEVHLGASAVVAAPPTDPPVVTDNPFIPEEKNLSDCVSAVPQPGCGSEARGGWRQGLAFGAVVVGLAFIGWRITRVVRRTRRAVEASGGR